MLTHKQPFRVVSRNAKAGLGKLRIPSELPFRTSNRGKSPHPPPHQYSKRTLAFRRRPASCGARRLPQTTYAITTEVQRDVERWMALDEDPKTRAEIKALVLAGEEDELVERLGLRLQFGTAGLRGLMGAGFNRMNHLTVIQATQGLWKYLEGELPDAKERGVAIGFDARHGSALFAQLAAKALVAKGVRVYLFGELVPTPLLAFAVSHFGCSAGIMVTASHNPKDYNGYKVYASNGCQIIPPMDVDIAAAIEANCIPWETPQGNIAEHPLVSNPAAAVKEAYFARIRDTACQLSKGANAAAPRVAYTPLHGVGLSSVQHAFREFGLAPPAVVAAQAQPDPDFPTIFFPNPEEGRDTWALVLQEAEVAGCMLALANDPDADRLAVAERVTQLPTGVLGIPCTTGAGFWRPFSGNEIGILLAHWVWINHCRTMSDEDPTKVAMLASTVSSKMLRAMAEVEGFTFEETLTGFKWLGNRALQLKAEGFNVLFAFEEAIGFMFPKVLYDKDGVAAAGIFAEMAGQLAAEGKTVGDHLSELYTRYGCHAGRQGYFIAPSPEVSQAIFSRLRESYPTSCGPFQVTSVMDLGTGLDTGHPTGRAQLPWDPSLLHITMSLEQGATLTLRASGTEPKLKYYLEVVGSDQEEALGRALALESGVSVLLQADESGLKSAPSL